MFIFRLLLIISAVFVLLVLGMVGLLFLRMRNTLVGSFGQRANNSPSRHYPDDGKTIEGEYKVIDVPNKE